jgi:hypothetical protein
MARKTLLTENELRRFMTLANMRPVGDRRLQEMGKFSVEEEMAGDEEVEDLEATFGGDELPGEPDDALALDAEEAPEELPMDDMALDADAGADPALEEKFTEFMTQVAAVAQEVLGIDVAVEGDEEAGELDMAPEEDELAVVDDVEMSEPTGEEGGELEMDADVEVEEEDPPGMGGLRYEANANDDELVAEVARRVAARLQKGTRQAEVVDQLAERIMKRLTK